MMRCAGPIRSFRPIFPIWKGSWPYRKKTRSVSRKKMDRLWDECKARKRGIWIFFLCILVCVHLSRVFPISPFLIGSRPIWSKLTNSRYDVEDALDLPPSWQIILVYLEEPEMIWRSSTIICRRNGLPRILRGEVPPRMMVGHRRTASIQPDHFYHCRSFLKNGRCSGHQRIQRSFPPGSSGRKKRGGAFEILLLSTNQQ